MRQLYTDPIRSVTGECILIMSWLHAQRLPHMHRGLVTAGAGDGLHAHSAEERSAQTLVA